MSKCQPRYPSFICLGITTLIALMLQGQLGCSDSDKGNALDADKGDPARPRITLKPMGRFDSPDWKNFRWVVDDTRKKRDANLSIPTTGSKREDYLDAEEKGYAFRVPLGTRVEVLKRNKWGHKWFFEDIFIEVLEGAQKGRKGWLGVEDFEFPSQIPSPK